MSKQCVLSIFITMSRPISITSAATAVLGTYTLVSGTFNGQGGTYFSGLVGKGVDGSQTTSNYYSNGSGNIVIFTYNLAFNDIPSNATITGLTCQVNGHAESTSNQNEYMCVQLYCNDAAISDETNFKSLGTSNTTITLTATTLPTMSNLSTLKLRCRLGYYGGAINGATATLGYTVNGTAYTVTASSNYTGATISPASQELFNGESATVQIYPDDINNIIVEDNGTDVTDHLQYVIPQQGTQTFTGVPTTYDSQSSSYYDTYNDTNNNAVNGVYNNNVPENGLRAQNSSTRACVFSNTGASAISKLVYGFDCSTIPSNATITNVTCVAGASCYSSGQYFATKTLQLYCGNTAKGTAVNITGNGSTAANHTINGGSWTRAELDNIKIVEYIQRTTSNTSTAASFNFWGATLTVEYTLPTGDPYYTYTISNLAADHTILVSEAIIVPPEEDPQKTYYSVTISSINATTDPGRGTTRIESGSGMTITITPSDSQTTLVTDNGVDITNQLVAHGGQITSSTTTAQGASYGFIYCASTGYYTSTNKGVQTSAAVNRVTFNLPVRCLITIQFINYAEATYDYGIFGNIDTALGTTSGSDTNAKLVCNTSTYNQSSPQTLTYEMQSGSHFIDIKYRKDNGTDSYNDNLQFKILSIEELEPNNYYTYTLSNVSAGHSLVFIFGEATYYFVTSSTDSNARLYPDGQMVQLPGDTYKLTVVPNNTADTISVRDNNTDVTGSLVRKEETVVKEGVSATVVNYIYTLSNIQTGHTIVVYASSAEGNAPYIKINGNWVRMGTIYKKVSGAWERMELDVDLFDTNTIYINKDTQ